MSQQPPHALTMIPGPIEFDDDVLSAMSQPSVAHTAKPFIETFGSALKLLRKLFFSTQNGAQPFVIAGGGTLGWDISAANFLEPGDRVLLLNTGFFSHSWAEAFRAYQIEVTELKAEVGNVVPLSEVTKALDQHEYKVVAATHVDTSTAVLTDVQALSKLVHEKSPKSLVFVDGVCSVGVELIKFDEWQIDFVMTASQKAVGVPAGLSISMVSERALQALQSRKTPVPSFFADLNRWLPIMQAYEKGEPKYFSTPPVQTIYALQTSLAQFAQTESSLHKRFADHAAASDKIKDTLEKHGIELIARSREVAAHGLTAAFLPKDWNLPDLLPKVLADGFVIAGGILPPIAPRYFRIGHMGASIPYGYIDSLAAELDQVFSSPVSH